MKKNKAKSLKKRNLKKLQYGSLSIALTVAFIAAILLGNAAISYVTDRYSLKADISAEGLYQISEQTEIMLKNLDQPVRAYILMSEANAYAAGNDYYAVASEFLKRFVTLSDGKFSVEFIDVYKNPAFMNKYDEESGISAGSFIIESDTRYRVCSMYDLYEVSVSYSEDGTATQYISGFQADETFASMLHYVTTGELPTVVQITGHREYYDEVFLEIFEKNNYEILECNLSMEEIPASADIILISSPKVDFTEAEIEKIDKYLREDFGSAMVFVDFDSYDLDLFELYFEEWGIGVEQKMVMDSARAISMPFMVVPYVQNNDFIDGFSYDENTIYSSISCNYCLTSSLRPAAATPPPSCSRPATPPTPRITPSTSPSPFTPRKTATKPVPSRWRSCLSTSSGATTVPTPAVLCSSVPPASPTRPCSRPPLSPPTAS